MKKIYLFLTSAVICLSFQTKAQYCFPDLTLTAPGFKPDTIENLDSGKVGILYDQTINAHFPKDTVINQVPGRHPFDSILINSVEGLPVGLEWYCQNMSCKTTITPTGNNTGCIRFVGTPLPVDTGWHKITIQTTVYARLFGSSPITVPWPLTGYWIYIAPDTLPVCDAADVTSTFIFPTIEENLPIAWVDSIYSKAMTFNAPADSTLQGTGLVTIDSMKIKSITGFPNNFDYACNSLNCFIPGGLSNCIIIQGRPGISEIGNYPLTIKVDYYYHDINSNFGVKDTTITGYNMYVASTDIPVCTPVNNGIHFIRPDIAHFLNEAWADTVYFESLNFFAPKDTIKAGNIHLTVDSIRILSIDNLPDSLEFECNHPRCLIPGGQMNCMNITGIPQKGDTGIHNLTIKIRYYCHNTSFVQETLDRDVSGYFIRVRSAFQGITELLKNKIKQTINIPNPFTGQTEIYYWSDHQSSFTFNVYSMFGELIYSGKINSQSGTNSFRFDATGISKGIYYYTLQNNSENMMGKMTVQ